MRFFNTAPVQKAVIELKILHKSLERTIPEGLAQTREYMDRCEAKEGHLIVFDRRKGISWEEKFFVREEEYQVQRIIVWGMWVWRYIRVRLWCGQV